METTDVVADVPEKFSFNLAIVGGGTTCKSFLNHFVNKLPGFLDVHISSVCDINPNAEGLVMAREMGISTSGACTNIFNTKGIDAVLELTNNAALADIMKHKPPNVAVIEHNAGRLLESFLNVSRKLASARKRIELEKSSYDVLFQQSNLGVLVLNPDFTIVDANATCLRAVKKTKEEAVGNPCHEIIKGFYAPCSYSQIGSECPVLRTLRTGRSSIMIHEHTSAEGQTSYFNIATYPIKDENGAIIRIIELWREITREISYRWEKRVRRMETDMKRMIQEDRMISLGRLVASCVHEINNPIQGLLAFADLMQVILDEEEMTEANKNDLKKYAGLMSRELERCGSIISGLLSFSYESGMEYREMDLNEILGSVLTLTRHKMELSDIRPTIRLHPAPLPVVGDKNQLQQCFLNLIFNAAEAMPDGGELFVRSAVTEDNRSRIDIRDTGCGIPEDDMDHIFDPFFTTKEEGKGLGLGLFMVYGMVKNHKGTVKAESREGEGTRFVLTFPRP